jgi:hypothetical protein
MCGRRKFQNIDELKQLLLREKDQVARAMVRRLVTYATGGAPESADRAEIERVVSRRAGKRLRPADAVHEIVQSRMFREK